MADTAAVPQLNEKEPDVQGMDDSNVSSVSATPGSTPGQKDTSASVSSVSSSEALLDLKTVNEKILAQALAARADAKSTATKENTSNKPKMMDTFGNEFELPDFTFNQVRTAIPSHCFKRSATRSLLYTARDIVQWLALAWVFKTFNTPEHVPSQLLRGALWIVYSIFAGFIGTGLWVLAHECGHGAFSDSKRLNNTVGFILHSALGVPYFSWQISHRKHHQNTGNLDRDMVFVPATRQQYASRIGVAIHELSELAEETPILTALTLIGQQLAGWNMYLTTNTTGHNKHENAPNGRGVGKRNGPFKGVNHFQPYSPIFDEKDMPLIYMSDIGLLCWAAALIYATMTFGAWNVFQWYGSAYLWVNNWLVWITYLQHTDPTLPHYDTNSWTFTRGAAATIDRDFGFIGRYFMHDIVETHVVHHYFSNMPWYHAEEATEAIQKVMGRHYRANTEGGIKGFLSAIWTSARNCQWVEPTEGAEGVAKGVYFYRNHNQSGVPPAKMAPSLSSGESINKSVVGGDVESKKTA